MSTPHFDPENVHKEDKIDKESGDPYLEHQEREARSYQIEAQQHEPIGFEPSF